MKTIRHFSNIAEAGFAHSLLQAVGIQAVLADEHAFTMGPQNVPWGIRLQVPETEVDQALRVLDQQEGFTPLPDDFSPPSDPSTPTKLPPFTPPGSTPTALLIVAILFLLSGIAGVVDMIGRLIHHSIHFNFDILGIPIFFGLRRYSSGWRTCALVLLWIGIFIFALAIVFGLFSSTPTTFRWSGLRVTEIDPIWISIFSLPILLLLRWQYRVLTRPEIRRLFVKEESAAPC